MSKENNTAAQIRQSGFDTLSAIACAREGKIEDWVHEFLLSGMGGSTNLQFLEGLKLAPRWWNGPLEISLTDLTRAVGPEPSKEYLVDADHWQKITSRMAARYTDVLALPPLIVEYRAGELSVRDGNTRLGAGLEDLLSGDLVQLGSGTANTAQLYSIDRLIANKVLPLVFLIPAVSILFQSS